MKLCGNVWTWEPEVVQEKHIRNHFVHHKSDTDFIGLGGLGWRSG